MEKFFAAKAKGSIQADPPRKEGEEEGQGQGQGQRKPPFPKGVVLGKDGKPCRSCTSFADWAAMNASSPKSSPSISSPSSPSSSSSSSSISKATRTISSSSSSPSSYPTPTPAPPTTTTSTTKLKTASLQAAAQLECPPDITLLGRSTWTFLHTLSASYPPVATPTEQSEMRQFLSLFSKWYPCWTCAEDFRGWMGKKGNEPRVEGREGLGRWLCEAHNEVNEKLGKERFDCGRWEERWGGVGGEGC